MNLHASSTFLVGWAVVFCSSFSAGQDAPPTYSARQNTASLQLHVTSLDRYRCIDLPEYDKSPDGLSYYAMQFDQRSKFSDWMSDLSDDQFVKVVKSIRSPSLSNPVSQNLESVIRCSYEAHLRQLPKEVEYLLGVQAGIHAFAPGRDAKRKVQLCKFALNDGSLEDRLAAIKAEPNKKLASFGTQPTLVVCMDATCGRTSLQSSAIKNILSKVPGLNLIVLTNNKTVLALQKEFGSHAYQLVVCADETKDYNLGCEQSHPCPFVLLESDGRVMLWGDDLNADIDDKSRKLNGFISSKTEGILNEIELDDFPDHSVYVEHFLLRILK